ncbi:hypothetical protein DLJ57_02195, partial [Micromonospora chalcea]
GALQGDGDDGDQGSGGIHGCGAASGSGGVQVEGCGVTGAAVGSTGPEVGSGVGVVSDIGSAHRGTARTPAERWARGRSPAPM